MSTEIENVKRELRTMLARRADDVHSNASENAWDAIAARLDEPARSTRGFVALAGAAVAAALVAGVIVVSQNDSPAPVTASTTTTTSVAPVEQLPPHVWRGGRGKDAGTVIEAYLKNRLGTDVTTANYDFVGDDEVRATFLSREASTEVFGRKVGERWLVISAASDLVPIHEPTWDGTMTIGIVTIESDGSLMTAFGDEDWDGPHDVQAGESVPVRRAGEGAIRAVLRTSDGTVGLSEVWPSPNPAPVGNGPG